MKDMKSKNGLGPTEGKKKTDWSKNELVSELQ